MKLLPLQVRQNGSRRCWNYLPWGLVRAALKEVKATGSSQDPKVEGVEARQMTNLGSLSEAGLTVKGELQ